MNGEVQLIVTAGNVVTYKTGAQPNGVLPEISNDGTIAPVLSNDILNAFIAQVLNGGNGDIKAYDSSDNLLATYQLNPITSTTGGPGQYLFALEDVLFPDANTVYITFQLNIVQQVFLDLFENESISQNWRFQDLSNFTAQGSFSREFRIPLTQNNQNALGALFDINNVASNENYFHYKLPAEIRVDTLPITSGYIRVRKIYKQLNKINEIELAFYSETPDFVRNIGEKKLSDITDLPSLNEVISYDNVTTPTANRIWTLCDRGQRWSEGGEQNTRSLINENVYAEDLTPALNWWYLFEQIIKDAGFELAAGTLNNLLEDYWMPWCNQSSLIGSDSYNSLFFRAYPSAQIALLNTWTTIQVNTEIFDNNNNFDPTTYTFTASGGGWYRFRAILKFATATTNTGDVIVALSINGNPAFNEMFIGTVTNNSYVDCNLTVALNTGDTVQLVAQLTTQLPSPLYVQAGDSTYGQTLFEIDKTDLFFGQTIFYNLNAPDMKQIDFVTDVIKMHNCAIVPDRANANLLYIVPQTSYLGSGATLDWTNKLDISKDIVISSTADLQKAKFQFTYSAGDDIISQQYKVFNRIYGDYEAVGYTINPNILPSDFATGDQKIQLVTKSTPAGLVRGSGYVIPIFLNSSLEFVPPGPRCLYEAGTYSIRLYDDGISAPVFTFIPVLNNYSTLVADINDYDLNWAPETPAQTIISNPYNNLFNLYWRSYMNSLYSPEARLMEASFALDLNDILTFTFADKIWIENAYWRIIEISDYKFGMYESTKVKLLKIIDDTEDCASTPVSVSTNGQVNFEDANGDPVEATQDCCSRYGYNWDEVAGICWAFTPTGERPNSGVSGTPTSPAPRVSKAVGGTRSIVNSVIEGETVQITDGNKDTLAVGNSLKLTEPVRGNAMLGKNVFTKLPGFHLGGGWKDDNILLAEGGTQHGIVMLSKMESFAYIVGAIITPTVENVSLAHLEFPDDTYCSCLMHIVILDKLTNQHYIGLYQVNLYKIGAIAGATTPILISEENLMGAFAFAFSIDTTTFTNKHKVDITLTAAGGVADFNITIALQYTQVR